VACIQKGLNFYNASNGEQDPHESHQPIDPLIFGRQHEINEQNPDGKQRKKNQRKSEQVVIRIEADRAH
jgi:hypothetical protein